MHVSVGVNVPGVLKVNVGFALWESIIPSSLKSQSLLVGLGELFIEKVVFSPAQIE